MTWQGVVLRGILVLVFTVWSVNVLAVAVFAVGDRYDGVELVFFSLVVLIGGFAPVALCFYLFRDRILANSAPERSLQTPRVRNLAFENAHAQPEALVIEALSDRELEVLSMVARGYSNKEIASHLSITVGTVKTHTNNINRKLGSRTRTQAIARARELGVL